MQKVTDWQPSPKQRAVLEAAQEAGLNRDITSVCEAAGVTRTSFYRWLQGDEGFRRAWQEVWSWSIDRHLPGVVSAMIEKAKSGDVQAARLIADMAGVIKQRVAVGGDEGAPALRIVIDDAGDD